MALSLFHRVKAHGGLQSQGIQTLRHTDPQARPQPRPPAFERSAGFVPQHTALRTSAAIEPTRARQSVPGRIDLGRNSGRETDASMMRGHAPLQESTPGGQRWRRLLRFVVCLYEAVWHRVCSIFMLPTRQTYSLGGHAVGDLGKS